MKKISLAICLLSLFVSTGHAVNLRLMTGHEQNTYHQIGGEIAEYAGRVGLNLQVLSSEGSWANISALFNNDTEFAIFQVDAFNKAAANLYQNTGKNIYDEIRVVMPLYYEEIHVIKKAGRELDFATEEEFLVGCGPENGGSCISAEVIAGFYGKGFSYRYSSYETALDQLRSNELDLVIITAGKPAKFIAEQTGIDLVSLPRSRQAVDIYLHSTITSDDYPWLAEPVETYGVRSVLATMIQQQEGLANNIVGTLHFSLLVNEKQLKANGHPKWKDVLFQGFNQRLAHEAIINSLGACQAIREFGHDCGALAEVR